MFKTPVDVEFGHALDSIVIERGLRELCPGIHFDLAVATNQWHPYIEERQGVYYMGKHITGMDRGSVPEFKLWNTEIVTRPGEWHEADKEDASIMFRQVDRSDPNYPDLEILARSGRDHEYGISDKGNVIRRTVMISKKVRGRCIRLGWRHTFWNLIGYPGITAQSLATKFGVDMSLFPVGGKDEISAAIHEE